MRLLLIFYYVFLCIYYMRYIGLWNVFLKLQFKKSFRFQRIELELLYLNSWNVFYLYIKHIYPIFILIL